MTLEDLAALRRAVQLLEHPGLAARLTNMVGKPIELIGDVLPDSASHAIATATSKGLEVALKVALRTMQRTCRFQKLDSCVPVMQSAQDCMCDDVPEALDRAPVRRILSERNMRTPPIIIGGEFRKDPPQVLFVEHDQMIGTLAPDRPDQALNMAVLPGRAE